MEKFWESTGFFLDFVILWTEIVYDVDKIADEAKKKPA
jgi:hypothetical protein